MGWPPGSYAHRAGHVVSVFFLYFFAAQSPRSLRIYCDHFCACFRNSVNFGLRTAKNRTGISTNPTSGHHAGLCHAFQFSIFLVLLIVYLYHLSELSTAMPLMLECGSEEQRGSAMKYNHILWLGGLAFLSGNTRMSQSTKLLYAEPVILGWVTVWGRRTRSTQPSTLRGIVK